jgi:hypothetical protein
MEEIDTLKQHHKKLEAELAVIEAQVSWTPAEQMLRTRLKKEKLAIKDRIVAISQVESAVAG